ncbi:MAG: glycosyltransferase [Betaproteobacteria bacterium]|nr:glycosyltransferase [Betaproteobacteria bacterium]
MLILGVHLKSEGYPNVLYRLRDLQAASECRVAEINVPMWTAGTQGSQGLRRVFRNAWRAVFAPVAVIARFLAAPRPQRAYLPYPAVPVLALLSLLPKRLRPGRTVADAFISLYDTIVEDRRIFRPGSLPARLTKRLERRAYRAADMVVVDTPQSAAHLAREFGLPRDRVVAVPLSTDEDHFRPSPYVPSPGTCSVLFVGTFIPLHGAEVIAGAARLLADRPDIRFRLVGDGQTAPEVGAVLGQGAAHVEWERGWQSSARLAAEIARADICVGIFGGGDKAQRICPLKVYAYCAVGRAVITGETRWTRETLAALDYEPFVQVPPGSPEALAGAIVRMATDPQLRIAYARAGRRFYEQELSNAIALRRIRPLLC